MANASAKKLAATNAQALNQLHLISLSIFVPTLLLSYFFGRPLRRYIFLSVPAWTLQYFLEKNARPVYKPDGSLARPGSDISQKGLTEYMLDVIYMTWICAVLSTLIGGIAWWLYAVIPGFALYKAWGLLQSGRSLLGGGSAAAAASAEDSQHQSSISKRQEKLQKRNAKRQVPGQAAA